jgi:hypothetical protein
VSRLRAGREGKDARNQALDVNGTAHGLHRPADAVEDAREALSLGRAERTARSHDRRQASRHTSVGRAGRITADIGGRVTISSRLRPANGSRSSHPFGTPVVSSATAVGVRAGPVGAISTTTMSTRPGLPGRSGRGAASAAPGPSVGGLAGEARPVGRPRPPDRMTYPQVFRTGSPTP